MPNWDDTYDADKWVDLEGEFAVNASTSSSQGIAVAADAIEPVPQPADPYIYK
jgi:putative membrane protein